MFEGCLLGMEAFSWVLNQQVNNKKVGDNSAKNWWV